MISPPNKITKGVILSVPTLHGRLRLAMHEATRRYGWNRRAFNQIDFDLICRHEGIDVEYHEDLKRPPGLYTVLNAGQRSIALYAKMMDRGLTWVQMHELGHHFFGHLPPPLGYQAGKPELASLEDEADLFAACALIPRFLLDRHTIKEILPVYPVASELGEFRVRIKAQLGI